MRTNSSATQKHREAEPPRENLFRRLEAIEQDMELSPHSGQARWMIPYADLLTLLLGLFLVLLSTSPKVLPDKTAPDDIKSSKGSAVHKKITLEKNATEKKMADDLQGRLKKFTGIQGVEVHQQERGLVISLKDSVLFSAGSAELSPDARKVLEQLTSQLTSVMDGQTRPIRVEGHTDNTPITTSQYPSNWELSTARATNIVRYLINSHQIAPENISAAGYGEFKPVQNNSSIEGKQKNRRVDIVVLNDSTMQQEPPNLSDSDLRLNKSISSDFQSSDSRVSTLSSKEKD